jgi:hypothetical protein
MTTISVFVNNTSDEASKNSERKITSMGKPHDKY